jgi:hypothetical protein
MNKHLAMAVSAICIFAWSPTVEADSATKPIASATKSREIGGFALGMPLREAAKLARIEPIGGYQFDTERDGLQFNFEVTPLGRIYRIQSSQRLGRFAEDQAFRSTLLSKLTAKYGAPASVTGSMYHWELVERVRSIDPVPNPFTTMWMTASISDDDGEKSLEMKMIDFRILWADQAQANQPGRAAAENSVKF